MYVPIFCCGIYVRLYRGAGCKSKQCSTRGPGSPLVRQIHVLKFEMAFLRIRASAGSLVAGPRLARQAGECSCNACTPTIHGSRTAPAADNRYLENGALGETRTRTAYATAPSRQRVYQFHHQSLEPVSIILMSRVSDALARRCGARRVEWP